MQSPTPSKLSTSFDSLDSPPIKSPTGNPLKYDPELMALIDKIDTIQSFRAFRRWRASFLRRFKSFLAEKGIQPAQECYQNYSSNMEKFETKVNQVQNLMEQGNLSAEKTTVKGRNALNEMCKTMAEVTEETELLIPATKDQEKKRRYNKYHLGCILVEDGFQEYDRMIRCNEKKKKMVEQGLAEIADRQQLDAIMMYDRQIQRFVDVMKDLGLYEVMLKCREFAGGEIDEIIFLDPKSGAVIEMPRHEAFAKGVLTIIPDPSGKDKIREEEVSRTEKQELISTFKVKFDR